MPRRSGKTSQAVSKFLESPHDSIMIVYSNIVKQHVVKNFRLSYSDSFKIYPSSDVVIYPEVVNVIIDDYDILNNTREIYAKVMKSRINNLYVYTTMNNTINKNHYDFVKKCKDDGCGFDAVLSLFMENFQTTAGVSRLYYNFVTDPDVELRIKLINF